MKVTINYSSPTLALVKVVYTCNTCRSFEGADLLELLDKNFSIIRIINMRMVRDVEITHE